MDAYGGTGAARMLGSGCWEWYRALSGRDVDATDDDEGAHDDDEQSVGGEVLGEELVGNCHRKASTLAKRQGASVAI